MEMPEGWNKLLDEYNCLKIYHEVVQAGVPQCLMIMKEMAEALEKVQTIAEMTMPNGRVTPTPLYNDVTPVLNKFKEWK
jgi:hypothetical protein